MVFHMNKCKIIRYIPSFYNFSIVAPIKIIYLFFKAKGFNSFQNEFFRNRYPAFSAFEKYLYLTKSNGKFELKKYFSGNQVKKPTKSSSKDFEFILSLNNSISEDDITAINQVCNLVSFSDANHVNTEEDRKQTYLYKSFNTCTFEQSFCPHSRAFTIKFPNLAWNSGKKFNFGCSTFSEWSNYIGSNPNVRFLINKRLVWSFQIQFNYSDKTGINILTDDYSYIHSVHKIFPDMHNLPFAVNDLRPYFDNPPILHALNKIKKMQYACTYYMRTEMFNRILFDRYLFTHAKYILNLPYTFLQLNESRYTINFNTLFHSKYSFYYFTHFSDSWFYQCKFPVVNFSSQILGFNFIHISAYYQYIIRKQIIINILSIIWLGVSKIRVYFENSVTPFMLATTSAYDADAELTKFFSHGFAGDVAGIIRGFIFDRISSRVMVEFSKFLYSATPLEIEFIREFIENNFLWVNQSVNGWSTEFLPFSNTLAEYSEDYRQNQSNKLFALGDFENLFVDLVDYFFDYELYLFIFFGTLVEMLEDPKFALSGKFFSFNSFFR